MTSAKNAAGVLLVAVPLVFTAGFTGLQMTFDYPDIQIGRASCRERV